MNIFILHTVVFLHRIVSLTTSYFWAETA